MLNLSGCLQILGLDFEPADWCESTITILGPDQISGEQCDPLEIVYNAIDSDGTIISFNNSIAGDMDFQWVVSGDIELISGADFGSLVIRATNEQGNGTISLVGKTGCGKKGDVEHKTWATKTVTVLSNTLDFKLNLCRDKSTGLGTGSVTVIDQILGDQNYQWAVLPPSAATPKPSPGTGDCFITDINADFTLSVQKVGSKCIDAPVTKEIYLKDLPDCQQ